MGRLWRDLAGGGLRRDPEDRFARRDRRPRHVSAVWTGPILCAAFLIFSVPAAAQNVRYLYDDLGRLERVIDEHGDIATYKYDAVGNILSIERGPGDCPVGPPTVGDVTATVACLVGGECEITIDGESLLGGGVTTASAEAAVSRCRAACNQITCRLTLTPFVAVGALPLTVTTGFGSSQGTVQVDHADVNLLQNTGAESGMGSPSGTDVLPIPAWATTSNFTVVKYGASTLPTVSVSQAIGGGVQFFSGGPSNPLSTAVQIVDLTPAATGIDSGTTTATLSAYLGGYLSQGDSGTITAIFLGDDGQDRGRLTIGPVTASDRHNATTLLFRSGSGTIPAGTRAVRVVMTSTRTAGSNNDGYFDNLFLGLSSRTP